jgi:hypothetical protein
MMILITLIKNSFGSLMIVGTKNCEADGKEQGIVGYGELRPA